MRKPICIFSFEIKRNEHDSVAKICYCYGSIYSEIYKSGTMNLVRSPFLINIFLSLINKLKTKYELHMVSNIRSITEINIYLSTLQLEPLLNVIDINSCSIIWKLHDSNEKIPIDYKEIYKKYTFNIFQKENFRTIIFSKEELKKLNSHEINILLQGMSYAVNYKFDAIKIISDIYQMSNTLGFSTNN
jgi:hypothetical protein